MHLRLGASSIPPKLNRRSTAAEDGRGVKLNEHRLHEREVLKHLNINSRALQVTEYLLLGCRQVSLSARELLLGHGSEVE